MIDTKRTAMKFHNQEFIPQLVVIQQVKINSPRKELHKVSYLLPIARAIFPLVQKFIGLQRSSDKEA
jgi:hypothetical protein